MEVRSSSSIHQWIKEYNSSASWSRVYQSWNNTWTSWISNVPKASITTTYVSGTSGYRVYSDGFIEQWGRTGALTDATTTITFSKAFKNTNYCLVSMAVNAGWRVNTYSSSHTATTAVIGAGAINGSGTGSVSWYACGY